jgi:hypothetical protein
VGGSNVLGSLAWAELSIEYVGWTGRETICLEFIIGWMTVLSFAIRERHDSYNMWNSNVNRVRGDRLWADYIAKRRHADALVEKKYSEFVPDNLDPSLPPRKLYYNLRRLGPKRFNGDTLWGEMDF